MSDRRPGRGRYAHPEREQRWLLTRAPVDAAPLGEIFDRYIGATQLRLRRVESEDGVVFKLGQKVRAEPTAPKMVNLTNMYLS